MVKHVRVLVLAQGILSKLAYNPLIPEYIRDKFKRARLPLVRLIDGLSDLLVATYNWRDRVQAAMTQVNALFNELNIMETRVASDSLQKKAIKTALMRLKGELPHL